MTLSALASTLIRCATWVSSWPTSCGLSTRYLPLRMPAQEVEAGCRIVCTGAGEFALLATAVLTSANVVCAAASAACKASSFWSSALPAFEPWAASNLSVIGFTSRRSTTPCKAVMIAARAALTAGVPSLAWAAASKFANKSTGAPPASLATSSSVSGVMLTFTLPAPLPSITECSAPPVAGVTLSTQGRAPPLTLIV